MITRALAVYGTEYIKPTLVWMVTTIVVSLCISINDLSGRHFPYDEAESFHFHEEYFKIGLFAAATNSSAATLPLNTKNASMSFVLRTSAVSYCRQA